MVKEQLKALRTRLDKYPILEDAEVGHSSVFVIAELERILHHARCPVMS